MILENVCKVEAYYFRISAAVPSSFSIPNITHAHTHVHTRAHVHTHTAFLTLFITLSFHPFSEWQTALTAGLSLNILPTTWPVLQTPSALFPGPYLPPPVLKVSRTCQSKWKGGDMVPVSNHYLPAVVASFPLR